MLSSRSSRSREYWCDNRDMMYINISDFDFRSQYISSSFPYPHSSIPSSIHFHLLSTAMHLPRTAVLLSLFTFVTASVIPEGLSELPADPLELLGSTQSNDDVNKPAIPREGPLDIVEPVLGAVDGLLGILRARQPGDELVENAKGEELNSRQNADELFSEPLGIVGELLGSRNQADKQEIGNILINTFREPI